MEGRGVEVDIILRVKKMYGEENRQPERMIGARNIRIYLRKTKKRGAVGATGVGGGGKGRRSFGDKETTI